MTKWIKAWYSLGYVVERSFPIGDEGRGLRTPGTNLSEASVFSLLRRFRALAQQHRVAFAVVGFALFFGFIVYAVATFPTEDIDTLSPWYLVPAVAVVAPLMQLAKALEFRAQARMLGEHIELHECHEVTLNASIANLMPVPGSVLVRTARLSRNNSTTHAALTAIVAGLCWLGVSMTLCGAALIAVSVASAGAALTCLGIALAAAAYGLGRSLPGSLSGFGELILVEVLLTAVGAASMYLAFRAIGFDIDVLQTVVVAVSGPLASAAGIFPSGIGLSEALVSGLGTLLDIPAQLGFLAAALSRLTTTIGLFVGRAVVALRAAAAHSASA